METGNLSWKRNLIEYYDTLEVYIQEARRMMDGNFHTHFGLINEAPDEYCFCRALFLPDLFPGQYKILNSAINSLQQRIFRNLDPGFAGNILDVGCGSGGTLGNLARWFPEATLHGINLNSVQLKKARGYLGKNPRVHLYKGDFNTFQFPKTFSLLYFIESAFHNPDKQTLCDRIGNLLEPDGELRIVEFFLSPRMEHLVSLTDQESSLFHYWSIESWQRELGKRGIEVYEYDDTSPQVAQFLQFRLTPDEFEEKIIARYSKPGMTNGQQANHMRHLYEGYERLGRMLQRNHMRYGVLKARKTGKIPD